jgi:hypothetical protein
MMDRMDDKSLAEWLLQQAGPAIRYRAAAELFDDRPKSDLDGLLNDLLESPEVERWLALLDRPGGVGPLHSSKPAAFENVMGKLFELGVRAGVKRLDEKTTPFRQWLAEKVEKGALQAGDFYARLAAGALARIGYTDAAVAASFERTLERLHRTARKGSCDIWLPPEECANLPRSCRGKPFIRPEFLFGGETPLPLIHDIYGFAGFLRGKTALSTRRKINDVIGYILLPAFQKLPGGYGYFLDSRRRRCWAHGWGVRLPTTDDLDNNDFEAACFLQRLELMAHFPRAVKSRWFASGLRRLDDYRTEKGTYRFPARFLKEQKSGYYVAGAYMGLGENRRCREGMEIESTFRVLRIRRLIAAHARADPKG